MTIAWFARIRQLDTPLDGAVCDVMRLFKLDFKRYAILNQTKAGNSDTSSFRVCLFRAYKSPLSTPRRIFREQKF